MDRARLLFQLRQPIVISCPIRHQSILSLPTRLNRLVRRTANRWKLNNWKKSFTNTFSMIYSHLLHVQTVPNPFSFGTQQIALEHLGFPSNVPMRTIGCDCRRTLLVHDGIQTPCLQRRGSLHGRMGRNSMIDTVWDRGMLCPIRRQGHGYLGIVLHIKWWSATK